MDFSLATLTLFCIPYFASQNYEEVIYNPETASGSILSILFTCFIFFLVLVTRKGKLRIIQHLSPNMTSLINSVFDVLRSVLESGSEVTYGQVVRAGILLTWNILSWSGGHEFEPWSVELEVLSSFILSRTWTKNFPYCSTSLSEQLLASLIHRGFISCFVIKKQGYLMSCQMAVTSPNPT